MNGIRKSPTKKLYPRFYRYTNEKVGIKILYITMVLKKLYITMVLKILYITIY